MYSTLDYIDDILNYDHTESYSECAIYDVYTWFSIHVTCLPFDPKYNKYQNTKMPIWKVHEGLQDSGRRLVRPRLQKQIWKLSGRCFSDWVSNLKMTCVELQRCSEAEMKHDETKRMLETATFQKHWWTQLVDRNEHLRNLGFKAKVELVLRVQVFKRFPKSSTIAFNETSKLNPPLKYLQHGVGWTRWLMGSVEDQSLQKCSRTKLSPNTSYYWICGDSYPQSPSNLPVS